MFVTKDIKEISRRERTHFLTEVAWGCQAWLFPADREWYVVYLNGITDTGEEIESQCGLVLCRAEDRIQKATEPCLDDIMEEQEMLDFLDSKFPCWKDVRTH